MGIAPPLASAMAIDSVRLAVGVSEVLA